MDRKFSQFGRRLPVFIVLLAGLLAAKIAPASSIIEVGLEEMVAASELVFEGKVVHSESRWTGDGTAIRTYVTFQVLDVLKGSASGEVTLSFLGGTMGDLSLRVTDLNAPVPGEKGVYFVESTRGSQVNPLYGWGQGHFLLVKHPSGKGELVLTSDAVPVIGVKSGQGAGKRRALSHGVVRGIKTAAPARVEQALNKRDFKQALRQLIFAQV